jgi:hypothetical protein
MSHNEVRFICSNKRKRKKELALSAYVHEKDPKDPKKKLKRRKKTLSET